MSTTANPGTSEDRANVMAAMDAVEIKVTVRPDQELRAERTMELKRRDEIDHVANGKRAVDKLFSKDQERFLGEFYKGPIDFSKLRVMGPIRVLRWKLTHEDFPDELTLEEWRLPDGDDLVEVSIKTSPNKASQAQKEFDAHLRKLGLDPEGAQETKTRTALEYFAKTHREAKS